MMSIDTVELGHEMEPGSASRGFLFDWATFRLRISFLIWTHSETRSFPFGADGSRDMTPSLRQLSLCIQNTDELGLDAALELNHGLVATLAHSVDDAAEADIIA